MTKIHVAAFTAGLLLAISGPSFAAHRTRHPSRGEVKVNEVVISPYGSSRMPAFDPKGTSAYPFGPGINFPYPDRPYGDPDRWQLSHRNLKKHIKKIQRLVVERYRNDNLNLICALC